MPGCRNIAHATEDVMEFKKPEYYDGKKVIAAVANWPHMEGSNQFCTLIPLFNHENGKADTLSADFQVGKEIRCGLPKPAYSKNLMPGMLVAMKSTSSKGKPP